MGVGVHTSFLTLNGTLIHKTSNPAAPTPFLWWHMAVLQCLECGQVTKSTGGRSSLIASISQAVGKNYSTPTSKCPECGARMVPVSITDLQEAAAMLAPEDVVNLAQGRVDIQKEAESEKDRLRLERARLEKRETELRDRESDLRQKEEIIKAREREEAFREAEKKRLEQERLEKQKENIRLVGRRKS